MLYIIDTHWARGSLKLFKQQTNTGAPVSKQHFAEITEKFNTVVSEQVATQLGHKCGFTKRLRDITPHRLALTLIAAMAAGSVETIADLQRKFSELTGTDVSYKPFHNQLSKPEFADFMAAILSHAMQALALTVLRPQPGSPLAQFDEILLQDGSSFALKDALAERFPGRFSQHSPAAVELHATMGVLQDQFVRVRLAADTQGERDFLPDAALLRRTLLIADRGYEAHKYFQEVDAAGGSFIVRCKANANPVVAQCWLDDGRVRQFAGKRLASFRSKLAGANADLLVRQRTSNGEFVYRMCLIWNPEHKSHMVLATNLDAADFAVTLVRRVYAVRWQIELAFKEWKSYSNLHKFNTAKAPIAQGLIWASLSAALIKRYLAQATQIVHDVATSTRKAAMCVGSHVATLLTAAIGRADLSTPLANALAFLATHARRHSAKRDLNDGRLAAGLEALLESREITGCHA